MNATCKADFDRNYQTHLKHLKLKGLQPKAIEACSRAIRRIGAHFDHRIDSLTEPQLPATSPNCWARIPEAPSR